MCVLLLPSPACQENRDSQPCPGVPPWHHNISMAFPSRASTYLKQRDLNNHQEFQLLTSHTKLKVLQFQQFHNFSASWACEWWHQKERGIIMLPPKPTQKFQGGKTTHGKLCLWKELECHCLCVFLLSTVGQSQKATEVLRCGVFRKNKGK